MKPRFGLSRGYTLVELVITVALIGVMASLATMSIRSLVPRYKFNSSVAMMHTEINNARLTAISRNHEMKIVFSESDDSYTMAEGNLSSGSTSWTGRGGNRMAGGAADIWKLEANVGAGTSDMTTVVYLPDGSARFFNGATELGSAQDGYIYLKGPAGVAGLESRLAIKSITGRTAFQWARGSSWIDSTRMKN